MVRVYPEMAPSLALGGRMTSTGRVIISLLQIEGGLEVQPNP
jgi:hypothetical protein